MGGESLKNGKMIISRGDRVTIKWNISLLLWCYPFFFTLGEGFGLPRDNTPKKYI